MKFVVAVLLVSGCGGKTATSPKDIDSAGPPDAAVVETPPSQDRWACTADGDCMTSCSLGAVNLDWYKRTLPQGETCQDGCASKGMGARCESGGCVAYRRDGKREDSCTKKDVAVDRWSCAEDRDCMNSCHYGAVNYIWYAGNKATECFDGCASDAAEAPRCIDRGCVAFRYDGKRVEECTRKDVP